MGTPEYAVPYLEGLIASGLKPEAVISQPDRPVGRKQTIEPTPVKMAALKYGIPVLQPENLRDHEWIEKIHSLKPDVIVVVAFGQIIPKSLLAIPPRGCVNVHPSLLPYHRGPSPLQEAILRGDTNGGVTIMLMDEKVDHGPLLHQASFPIDANETYETLREKTTSCGVPLLTATLRDWLVEKITPQMQDDDEATFSRLLTRDSGKISWELSSDDIERSVRALNPWPGTWTTCKDKRVKILEAYSIPTMISDHERGTLFQTTDKQNQLFIACGIGTLSISRLQLEGKKVLSAKDFIAGHQGLIGSTCV